MDISEVTDSVVKFINRVGAVTKDALSLNHTPEDLVMNTIEEIGEYAAARTIEKGLKDKPLKEGSKEEAIDTIICALSLFYASGGTLEELPDIGNLKLNKWDNRLKSERSRREF